MYCRLCLNKFRNKEFISLLSSNDGLNWRTLCWDYLRIEIKHTDIYSTGICQRCLKALKQFHSFCQHAQHCQGLLPQLHFTLKEPGTQHDITQDQLKKPIKEEPIDFENISDVPPEISSTNAMSDDLPKQNSVFVITETLESENNLEKTFSKNYSKRLRTSEENNQTVNFKKKMLQSDTNFEIPITENILLDTQAANEEFEATLAIKTEPLEFDEEMPFIENEYTGVFTAADQIEGIKDEKEFESTEYEFHIPVVKAFVAREEPVKKLKASFQYNLNHNKDKQNIKHTQYNNMEQMNSKSLQQVDTPFELDERIFRKIYRLSPDLVHFLIQKLDAQLRGTRITAISSEKLVLAALHFFATGCFQGPVGELWGINMSQPSISRAIHKVTDAINARMCQHNIRFPMTSIDRQAAKAVFASAPAPFHGAIGAIDCMHVAILAPTGDQTNTYFNEDGYHSINVQMICDPTLKILNVNARYSGSKDNAYIWNASVARNVMKRAFDNGDRFSFLLGDAKYPLEPWLMTPLPNSAKGTPDFLYNEALRRAQNPIHQLFAVLQGTWGCLSGQRELKYNPQFAGRIVNACSVLHNLQLSHQEFHLENFKSLELTPDNFYMGEPKQSTDLVLLSRAKNIRNHIISNYFN